MRTDPRDPIAARRPALAAGAALLLSLAGAWGCGDASAPRRLPVSGTVLLDGKPLPSGTITFAPAEGAVGASGEVRDGSYRIAAGDGPSPGRYRVEIVAVEPTGKRLPDPDQPELLVDEVRNLVPSQYNARTTLSVEVQPDAENEFRFELSSREEGRKPSRKR